MAQLRYTDGQVTVTLDGGLERMVRRALDAAAGETVRIMEREARAVADAARSAWYDPQRGVTRRTGASGQIDVVTTVAPTEVRVAVGSRDVTKARYVRRPGRLSTVAVEIERDEYWAAKRKGGPRAALYFRARKADPEARVVPGRYYRRDLSPLAADGAHLMPLLIQRPMRVQVRAITRQLGQAIVAGAGG